MSPSNPVRLPDLERSEMTPEQLEAADRISKGPRGAVIGPFAPLLRSPELMTRLQLVGEFLRFESTLDADLFELTVLLVARHWDQQFEWGFHHPLALRAGVPRAVVDDIDQRRRPSAGRPELAAVRDLVTGLLEDGAVEDATYDGLLATLGDAALLDLVAAVGYYTTLALTMNVARTPPPEGAPRMSVEGGA